MPVMHFRQRAVVFVSVLVLSLAFDQGSKAWAHTLPVYPASCTTADLIAHHCGGVPQPVIAGYWDWELAMNDGAAFSSLGGGGLSQLVFVAIAALALGAIGVAVARTKSDARLVRVAYGLIAGGALGNLIDRIHHGAVTDFVRWHVHEHMWPIFNVADAALLVGVGLLFLDRALRHPTKSRDRAAAA